MATWPNPLVTNDPLTAAKLNDPLNDLYQDTVGLLYEVDIRRSLIWHYTSNIIAGNPITAVQDTSLPFAGMAYQDPAALNDEWSNGFYVAAGDYYFKMCIRPATDGGIFELRLDGVLVSAFDAYDPAPAGYIIYQSSKTLTAGWHTLNGIVTGQNASSSGYKIPIPYMSIEGVTA